MGLENYIYIKKSLGKNNHPINVYKLRTMIKDADNHLDEILEGDFDQHGNPVKDNRITWWGGLLRRYWVDEIPQFLNLFKGDIKFVGIRPMREIDWSRYPSDIKEDALKQKPGLNGIQYSSFKKGDFNDHLKILRQYLEESDKRPYLTDLKYFSKIWYNIIFHGLRGS